MVMCPCPHQQLQYGASQVFSFFLCFGFGLQAPHPHSPSFPLPHPFPRDSPSSATVLSVFFFFFFFFSLGFDLPALPPTPSPLHGPVTRLHRASIDRDGKSLFLFFFLRFRFCLQ